MTCLDGDQLLELGCQEAQLVSKTFECRSRIRESSIGEFVSGCQINQLHSAEEGATCASASSQLPFPIGNSQRPGFGCINSSSVPNKPDEYTRYCLHIGPRRCFLDCRFRSAISQLHISLVKACYIPCHHLDWAASSVILFLESQTAQHGPRKTGIPGYTGKILGHCIPDT